MGSETYDLVRNMTEKIRTAVLAELKTQGYRIVKLDCFQERTDDRYVWRIVEEL